MKLTPNLGLKKPEQEDFYNVEDFNSNAEAIDAVIGDMSTVPTTSKNAAGAITELFTSVSDGKALVAGAITDKGVPTNPSDTFATMAANIESIPIGPDTSDATVTAADLLAGKVAYGKDDARIVGTMPDRSKSHSGSRPITGQHQALSVSNGGSGVVLFKAPEGYFDGINTWVWAQDTDLISSNIRAGKEIFGVQGNPNVIDTFTSIPPAPNEMLYGKAALANGQAIHGTAPLRGNTPQAGYEPATKITNSGIRIYLEAPAGLYKSGTWIFHDDPNFIESNIRSGVSLFGKVGTMKEGLPHIILRSPTEKVVYGTTHEVVKRFRSDITGQIEIHFTLRANGYYAYARTYINGVYANRETYALGSANPPETKAVHTVEVNAGDIVEIRAWNTGSSGTATIRYGTFVVLTHVPRDVDTGGEMLIN